MRVLPHEPAAEEEVCEVDVGDHHHQVQHLAEQELVRGGEYNLQLMISLLDYPKQRQ